jgi:hypothetical protein
MAVLLVVKLAAQFAVAVIMPLIILPQQLIYLLGHFRFSEAILQFFKKNSKGKML